MVKKSTIGNPMHLQKIEVFNSGMVTAYPGQLAQTSIIKH